MAQSCSTLSKIFVEVFLLNFLFLSCSCYSQPPSVQPPSYVDLPKLCNYDGFYKYGSELFHDIESCNVGVLRSCNVDKIYQLGDSISDVGNLIRESNDTNPYAKLPYGKSFPEGPTGRASNGKLIIDYLVMDAGLPLLPPFKNIDADFTHGVNFAVGGATALTWDVLADLNISSSKITNSSMSVQLDWMSDYFNSLCNNQTDCGGKLHKAVFILGPFGGSDYFSALFQGKSMHEIISKLLPKVVDAIMAAVHRLVGLGARRVVVPGLYSIYELPLFQQTFTSYPDMYDLSNDLAIHHNVQLREAIEKLNREERPNAIVAFANYYAAYKTVDYAVAGSKNIRMDSMRACCGSTGYFNVDPSRMCGAEGVILCGNADRFLSWDGLHLTQEGYRIMTKYLLYHLFFDLHCPYL